MDDTNCIICNKSGNLVTIHEVSIKNLIDSSKQRADGKFSKWSDLKIAPIHESCRVSYNRESAIKTAVQEHANKCVEGKKIMKHALEFDYGRLCIFCGETCNKYKQNIKIVKKDSTKDSIITKLAEKVRENQLSDSFIKNLSARLNSVNSLVNVEARYHNKCMSNFFDVRISDQVGRPPSESTTEFMNHIVAYIENSSNECQFSLNEIKEEYTGTYPQLSVIKSKLTNYY